EAVRFDLATKNKRGLYRISKTKGKRERFVYVNQQRELNVGKETELTPHTLRRSFTTYHAEKPFAGKIPANDNDIADILAAKKALSETKGEKPIISNKESNRPDNFLLINSHEKNPTIVDHQPDQTREMRSFVRNEHSQISPPKMKKFFSQPPALTANGKKETILLQKIKLLEKQLTQIQTERDNFKQLAQAEKQRADQAEMKLKTIAKTLYQLQKTNHYKQLAKEKPDRVEELKKKVSSNPDSLKKTGENIDSNLEEIKKYLEASEDIIKREAHEQPKIKTSFDNLNKSITELEKEIQALEIQYKKLETKTQDIKVKYAVGGIIAGLVAGIAL
ncbi:11158_t:CDS:2, partial [Cetraspora pellucida]